MWHAGILSTWESGVYIFTARLLEIHMKLTPRLVAVVGILALVPEGIYAVASGHLTTVMTAIAIINVCLIVGSLLLLFGPSPDGAGHGTAH